MRAQAPLRTIVIIQNTQKLIEYPIHIINFVKLCFIKNVVNLLQTSVWYFRVTSWFLTTSLALRPCITLKYRTSVCNILINWKDKGKVWILTYFCFWQVLIHATCFATFWALSKTYENRSLQTRGGYLERLVILPTLFKTGTVSLWLIIIANNI